MNDNPIINTRATVTLQLDELPTSTHRAIGREGADPDGTAGAGSGGEIALVPLVLTGRIFGEDVSEEGLEEGRAAADETGVNLNDAAGNTA